MKITFILNNSYINQLLVVITSILNNEYKENRDKIEFYINYFGNNDELIKIKDLINKYFPNNKFYYKNIIEDFPSINKFINDKYNLLKAANHIQTASVYCRLYLDNIWKEIDGILLYLDLDLLLLHPISVLFKIFEENPNELIYAVGNSTIAESINNNFNKDCKNIILNNKEIFSKYSEKLINRICDRYYNLNELGFNGGVWGINLTKTREFNYEELSEICIDINYINKIFNHNDQGIMNVIFYKNFYKLSGEWNELYFGCKKEWVIKYRSENKLDEIFNNAKIIHYNGPYKPWLNNGCYYKPSIELWNKYKKLLFVNNNYGVIWANTINLGDDIQTIAGINFLNKKGITNYKFINREKLSEYNGEPVKVIMNGWFMHNINKFPPSDKIYPIFISFHTHNEELINKHQEYFRKYKPIGCRDINTVNLFKKYNIDAYYTGCLTLYLDEELTKNNNKYLVDINSSCSYIPNIDIDLNDYKNYEMIEHDIKDKNIIENIDERLKLAYELLNKYKHADKIITSRLHCILPCRAFNTKAIFVHKKYNIDPRFTGLNEIINGDNIINNNNDNIDRELLKKYKNFFDTFEIMK